MKRRVSVVVTARPSYSRIKSALVAIADHSDLELQLIVGGSALLKRYGSAVDYIERDGFEIAGKVYMVVEGENPITAAKSTGLALVELATLFDNLRPDVVVTVADRYETMATAVAASYMNIPLAHVQGGEVTGSIDEKVRHAVTKLSNLHLVSTEKAAERVIRMGEDPEAVFVTGCPSIDLAKAVLDDPAMNFDPFSPKTPSYGGVGPSFQTDDGYLVVAQHPVTTEHDEALRQVNETLQAVCDSGLPAFWFWPNVDAGSSGTSKGIRLFREKNHEARIHFFRNLEPEDFLRLLYNSCCVVGNSSVGIRECSFLGVPAVDVGTRQFGRERGDNVVTVPYEKASIRNAIAQQVANGRYRSNPIYGEGTAGKRVAGLLASCELRIKKQLTY